ncbi:MAG: DNA polymerase III subunit alpha [Planctomycetota bacterium]|jgi:DNA polymerase-3 subunit alpha|nr:DNA polymerase III subunit alpha [Planctomycetota bacterium]
MTAPFVHLHVHSHYSPRDGVMLVDKMVARARELEQPAIALTDHGVMYGVIDLYNTAKAAGVKPLVGFEAYVAPGDRRDKSKSEQYAYNHLTLLARNYEGYQNLSRLCSEGFLTGFYTYPRIDKEILREWSGGVVALSGCLRGEIPQTLLAGKFDLAEKAALEYRDIFGAGHFFLEIMDNGIPEQKQILAPMRELSNRTGIPLVATADSHYLLPGQSDIQDTMICISTGKLLTDALRMHADGNAHLKSGDEMLAALPGFEDAVERTLEVADICNLVLPTGEFHLPRLSIPDGMTAPEYLEKLCVEGLKKRYADPLPPEVRARLDKEKEVIVKMGFPEYFLIVWDVVKFARENGIPVGPGRGSAAGSIVAYGLGITNLDPLKYDLFFERFLNEGRNEMPDIDLDFDKERRQEVVTHIIQTHGADHCAKIITFGCLSLKSGIRDVGRVMGVPLSRVDGLAKLVPGDFKPEKGRTPLESALATIPELKEEYDADPEVKKLLDGVGELEGVMRNTGVHAAGVLVADRPITDYGPLAARDGEVTTQYEMKALEKLGLCKIDVLGLETLSLLKNAVAIVKRTRGVDVDLDAIPLDDKPTFDMLSRGDSKGVFQFESRGFRQLLSRLKPDVFEDLIAAVAIYRPGPMQFLDSFINRKNGSEPISYLHPLMEPILNNTYGLILYQEQVQALAQDLAGFTLSEGDLMRRAMGKKDAKLMASYREVFIRQGAPTIGAATAEKVFDQIQVFAGYGFNKSHSACYAMIAYQTAYLKCHFPKEYMAALLTISRGDSDDIVTYMTDAEDAGIKVLPVDVNRSDAFFSVEGNAVRFGLAAVKGLGDGAAQAIENERRENGEFTDLFDFCARVDMRSVNKGAMEALVKAGAMDRFGEGRASLAAGLESAIGAGTAERKAKASGQMGLFSSAPGEIPKPALPRVPEWSEEQKLKFEKAVLGFYSSSHPLAEHAAKIKVFATASIRDLADFEDGSTVVVGGLLTRVQARNDKNNNRYAVFDIEDVDGKVGGVAFASVYTDCRELLVPDRTVFLVARVDRSRDQLSLKVEKAVATECAEEELSTRVELTIPASGVEEAKYGELKRAVAENPGRARLFFRMESPLGMVELRADERYSVRPSRQFLARARELFGRESLRLAGRRSG